jgi:hypothetical protein
VDKERPKPVVEEVARDAPPRGSTNGRRTVEVPDER